MDNPEPLWRRVFLNELVLAMVAAVVILYVAFQLATDAPQVDDEGRPLAPSSKPSSKP
jgi:hypothetical protein